MFKKGCTVWIRYSTGNGYELSNWEVIKDIDIGNLSSGWREKYRRIYSKNN